MSSARQWWIDLAEDIERRPIYYCKEYGKGRLWIYDWIRYNAPPFWKATPARFRRAWYMMYRKWWDYQMRDEKTGKYTREPPVPVAPNTDIPCPVS